MKYSSRHAREALAMSGWSSKGEGPFPELWIWMKLSRIWMKESMVSEAVGCWAKWFVLSRKIKEASITYLSY
ncbi:uncharacterized protein G2W53_003524 [Senna tora]|uniref:Uncharacterized protein n=1 Tax=Senna tora TaxID=362788 RepID=A0A835CFU3_9FABA|nr:uncharacterized protein G2W53_003524 [Senna tora]